jgi:WD40 repeat protein
VFAPIGSLVKQNFKTEKPDWISTEPVVEVEWNACLQTLEGHGHSVSSVAYSPDSQRLASGSADKTIKIWDAASGQCLQTLQGHSGSVWSVAFSPDGQRLASGSADKTIKIWDAASGRCLQTLQGHGGSVWSVAFSPDGQQLASGSADKTIKIWDAASWQCFKTLNIGTSVAHILFDHTGRYLITDAGRIEVPTGTTENAIRLDDLVKQGYGLGQDKSWITCNGKNVLWLPPEYRPSCSAVQGRMISIGCSSGRVFTISFSRYV